MTDLLFKAKENEFYIQLKEERYYFPGEDISGDVILDLKKASKTLNIKVTLEGTVEIGGRSLVLFSKSVFIAESPDGEKSYYLEPHTHQFPFRITIPSSKSYKVPSTLQIGKLLKVQYQLIAIYNKPLHVERLCPITSIDVNILEDINVESSKFAGEQRVNKELILTGETRAVKVSTIIGKRAAVKGDIIPISVTIEHIGVFVRDKAISIQLLRSVYYGRNKNELFGPKSMKACLTNIDISGPTSFTKTFNIQLPIPSNLCPTVDKSGRSFKIEYTICISINLNEQNPHRPETKGDIVIFNIPFTIGTYPRLAFSIDDDDEEEEDISQKDDTEYEQVAEKMKDLDLDESNAPNILQMADEEPTNTITNSPVKPSSSPHLQHKNTITHTDEQTQPVSPYKPNASTPSSTPTTTTHHSYNVEVISPPIEKLYENAIQPGEYKNLDGSPLLESQSPVGSTVNTTSPPRTPKASISNHKPQLKISPSEVYNDYQPILSPTAPSPSSSMVHRNDSIASSIHRTSNTASSHQGSSLGRNESVRWIVRNQDAPTPAAVTASVSSVVPNFPVSQLPVNNSISMPMPSINQAASMPQPYPYPSPYDNSIRMPISQQQPFMPYYHPHQPPSSYNNNNGLDFSNSQAQNYPFAGGFVNMPSNQPFPTPSHYPVYYHPN
ncbi:MAG: hypothetical protein EXX96DRAFT_599982 [Benjaminiella poitrasii]|nr:MAG: hypothetical protein EXX96DRAFT_599982 [Benjaminiella poitrasii]